jgi:hypothetical protein
MLEVMEQLGPLHASACKGARARPLDNASMRAPD